MSPPRDLREPNDAPDFSVCTLVTSPAEYREMVASFRAGGFDDGCEYIFADNSAGNGQDAFRGLNALVAASAGRYVILCHQDVRLISDGRSALAERLRELDRLDPDWALAGNAGFTADRDWRVRITDRFGDDQKSPALPARVVSLDENFIVLKRSVNLGPSFDVSGFHMYGVDLCVQAAMRGCSAFVVDFHLRHLGRGAIDASFYAILESLEEKYRNFFRTRTIQTTCTKMVLTHSRLALLFARAGRWRKKWRRLRRGREASRGQGK